MDEKQTINPRTLTAVIFAILFIGLAASTYLQILHVRVNSPGGEPVTSFCEKEIFQAHQRNRQTGHGRIFALGDGDAVHAGADFTETGYRLAAG